MTNLDRAISIVSALFFASLAVMLIGTPEYFYATIPGVADSGPMNLHLLRDVGIAYAVMALGMMFGLRDLRIARIATAGSACYLTFHALLHAYMEVRAHDARIALAESPGVYLPAVVMIGVALRFAARKDARPQ